MSDHAVKHYEVKIIKANLYVRMMTLNDDVIRPLKKTLLTSPASYPYLETLKETFLASTCLRSWNQENNFSREPIRRLATCLNTDEVFRGNNRQKPFQFRKFDLEQLYVDGYKKLVEDSPLSTTDCHRP